MTGAASVDAEVAATLETLRPELARLARELYDEPEIGFAEHASAARLAALLTSHGAEVEVGVFGLPTALRATFPAADGGAPAAETSDVEASHPEASAPHFAIIAECDALPGIGHACGHNIIAGVAVGAFLAAAPIVARLGGRLSLIGTPAEENGGGKELIIRAAHAAGAPWLGRNALDGVVTGYQGVAQLRQHILPRRPRPWCRRADPRPTWATSVASSRRSIPRSGSSVPTTCSRTTPTSPV